MPDEPPHLLLPFPSQLASAFSGLSWRRYCPSSHLSPTCSLSGIDPNGLEKPRGGDPHGAEGAGFGVPVHPQVPERRYWPGRKPMKDRLHPEARFASSPASTCRQKEPHTIAVASVNDLGLGMKAPRPKAYSRLTEGGGNSEDAASTSRLTIRGTRRR